MNALRRSPGAALSERLASARGDSLEAAVDRRVRHRVLERVLARLTSDLFAHLGDQARETWFRREELVGRRDVDRERAAFDLGHELGRADGRADAQRTDAGVHGRAARRLAERLRATVVTAGLPPTVAVHVLLDVVRTLLTTNA